MNRFKIESTAILLSSNLNSFAQPTVSAGKVLHQYLHVQHKRIGFNGVVLITKNNMVLYKEIVGQASVEFNIPLNIKSGFKIASITKSFTVMLVLLASQENKLQLNDSLAFFFQD